ncbi:MAG: aquaporin [Candidatus Nitrosopolaris sp.]
MSGYAIYGLKGFGGIAIGGIVGLDIFFLAFISGASMNPARSLAPALLSGTLGNLWLYWSATFIGTSTIAFLLKKNSVSQREVECHQNTYQRQLVKILNANVIAISIDLDSKHKKRY